MKNKCLWLALVLVLLLASSVFAAGKYQIKLKSGVAFNSDVSITINGKDYENRAFYGGHRFDGADEKYGWQTMDYISLNESKANTITYSVTEKAKEKAKEAYIPVLFLIYNNKQLLCSVLGSYVPNQDAGKKFTLKIPGTKKIKQGQYFFFKNLPTSRAIVVTTGFANGSLSEPEMSLSGLPADLIWVRFIKASDLPSVVARFDNKSREKRFEEYPFYITKPSFAYVDAKKGVVYRKTFSEETFKNIDSLSIVFKAKKFQTVKRFVVKDKAELAKAKKLVWSLLKKSAQRIEALNLDLKDQSEENKKKVVPIVEPIISYFEQVNPDGMPEFDAVMFLKSCPELAAADPNNYKLKVYKEESLYIAEIHDKNSKYPYADLTLMLKEKSGKLMAIDPLGK